MDGELSRSPHRLVNPDSLAPATGFSHAVVAEPGTTIYLGGQTGHRLDGTLSGEGVVEQFEVAAANVVEALEAAGGDPRHLVSMQILVTDVGAYRSSLRELGEVYRRHFGRHYPAIALLEVAGLFDPRAKVELMCVAVVPNQERTPQPPPG